ncbi:response regulator transcription factor [Sporosarcina sp. FSL K6-1522]|uniref:response regulator transcription factor n=1 Tax=Sporosarcina sp. FSL K6-1522 TaxID=2921554 RepID=UPI00315A75F8
MEQAKILVLDDEQAIGDMVDIILRKEGFNDIDVCMTYKEAEELVSKKRYDLHILDIMLPDGTGLKLARQIRHVSNAPIFFLTAKSSDADKLRGFMHGADDYITKPFNPLELAARVKVQTSRYMTTIEKQLDPYDFGHFRFDPTAAELIVNGETVTLPGKQFHLLELFCNHPGQVLSKEQLYEKVWGEDSFIDDNTIMVHIRRLREKIEVDPSRPKFLKTVRGIGYKLQAKGK